MKIIVSNQAESVEVARVLQKAAWSVSNDMTKDEIEQKSLSDILCAMRDSVEFETAAGNALLDNFNSKAIAALFRKQYPDATSVNLFVSCYDHEIHLSHKDVLDGITMRSLSGEWVKENK